MIITRALAAFSFCAAALAAPAINEARGVDFRWGQQKIRGVNIGGWLVLEPWITPSIFDKANQGRPQKDIVDEFTLGQKLGHDAALGVLRNHWNTWVRWEDFNKIKQSGFNVVRIPIGFWAYDTMGTPFVSGAAVYIDAAIDWARSLGLKMIIDLHGAPGSQNGYDNSGQRMGSPRWQEGDNVQRTLRVLKTISSKYAQGKYQDVVIGIQLLNEPTLYNPILSFDRTKQFYRDGYYQTRDTSNTPVILHDGFKSPSEWNGFLTPSDNNAQNVVIDHHEYQVFDNNLLRKSPREHEQFACSNSVTYTGADKWTFVGEWTGAMTDCAKYLNGYGRGARYDGTFPDSTRVGACSFQSDISRWPASFKVDTGRYIEAQMQAFDRTQGWFWWNFKTEGAAEWDAFRLIDAGVFPKISGGNVQYRYGKIC